MPADTVRRLRLPCSDPAIHLGWKITMNFDALEQLAGRRNNTRFAPTPASGLHLGHAWVAWLNREIAHRQNGKFILRMDTVLARYFQIAEPQIRSACDTILDELEWLGLTPDFVVWEDEYQLAVEAFLELHRDIPRAPVQIDCIFSAKGSAPVSRCILHVTPSRVVGDYILGCSPVVRGDDLLFEHWWYVYLCHRLAFPAPDMAYVPRVRSESGEELSRTAGNVRLAELRETGWTPDDIRTRIRQTCLEDAEGDICLANVHRNPLLRPDQPCN
jgi:glutamyl/glutaminyl-tRNA synthetase